MTEWNKRIIVSSRDTISVFSSSWRPKQFLVAYKLTLGVGQASWRGFQSPMFYGSFASPSERTIYTIFACKYVQLFCNHLLYFLNLCNHIAKKLVWNMIFACASKRNLALQTPLIESPFKKNIFCPHFEEAIHIFFVPWQDHPWTNTTRKQSK